MSNFSPEQKVAWRAVQKLKASLRVLYGWMTLREKPVLDEEGKPVLDIHGKPLMEQLQPGFYLRGFTHAPKSVILGAPKRGGSYMTIVPKNKRQTKRRNECKPVRYIVWHDRSLRRIDKILRKQFESLTPEQQTELITKAAML